jgi:hypothetical protein
VEAGESLIQEQPSKVIETLSQKQKINKRAEGVAQVVEHLPNM